MFKAKLRSSVLGLIVWVLAASLYSQNRFLRCEIARGLVLAVISPECAFLSLSLLLSRSVGALFQGRFDCEAIEGDSRFPSRCLAFSAAYLRSRVRIMTCGFSVAIRGWEASSMLLRYFVRYPFRPCRCLWWRHRHNGFVLLGCDFREHAQNRYRCVAL